MTPRKRAAQTRIRGLSFNQKIQDQVKKQRNAINTTILNVNV